MNMALLTEGQKQNGQTPVRRVAAKRRYAAHNKGRLTVRSAFFFVEPSPSDSREDDLD